jgi:integrase
LFDDIAHKRSIRTPKRYFQSHQMSNLCTEIMHDDEDLWLFIQLMFYCFLRPGEIRQIKISDIEFDDWVIYVRGDVAKNDKTKAVSIPDQFIPELRKLMGRKPNEFIFPGVRGPMLGRNTMYQRFRNRLKDHEYGDEYSLYSVRHTGAVAAAKAGASMKELQIQFRHHSLAQTDEYLRQLGIEDVVNLRKIHPNILSNHRVKNPL